MEDLVVTDDRVSQHPYVDASRRPRFGSRGHERRATTFGGEARTVWSDDTRDETDWSTRTVLVTGATGMVGSRLVGNLIRRGAAVVAFVLDHDPQSELVRSKLIDRTSVVNGRLEDFHAVERAIVAHEVDTVVHLGAQTIVGAAHRSPRATFEANVQGTWNVLDAARIHRDQVARVVIASSDKAYGTQPVLPYDEDMALLGRAPYEVSKSCADLLAQSYAHTYDMPVAIARCGNIYGPGDLNWSRIIPGTIRSLLLGQQPVLRSDGTFKRDYLHVDDAVSAYMASCDGLDDGSARGKGFNFSAEQPLTVLEVYAATCSAAGFAGMSPHILGKAVGEIKDQYLDSHRARRDLGWKAVVALEDGLTDTVAWYRTLLTAG